MNTTSVEITAGMGGFLVLFGLMVAVWLLGRDLTNRLRRMRLREAERVEAVRRERTGATGATGPRPQVRPDTRSASSGSGSTLADREPDPLA